MHTAKGRFYCLLVATMFIMFAMTPVGCSCSSKDDDDPVPGTGALTVDPGPQNGSTGGSLSINSDNNVMLQFTVSTGTAITNVISVKIEDVGSGPVTAAAVPAVDLWLDVNSNGLYDAGTDTLLAGPSTFNATDRTITFTVNRTLNAGVSEEWMVLYDFGASATGTYICTIQDVSTDIATTVGATANFPERGSGAGPISGMTGTVSPNTLTVAEGSNNPADDLIPGGQTDVAMLQFSLEAGPGENVTWTGVTFTASGTGDEVNDVALVELWSDTDNDGAPDSLIDTGTTYTTDNGTVSWSGLSETITASTTNYYILTYDFTATADGTFRVEIADVTTDVIAEAGAPSQAITPDGTSPVSGPTITVDTTPPYVVRAMFDGLDPDNPAAGDYLKIYFNEEITVGSATDASFVLPVTSDSLGVSPTVEALPGSTNAIRITLGSTPTLTIDGIYSASTTTAGSPSGIDVANGITAGEISDVIGNAAVQRNDAAVSAITGAADPAVDIKGKFIPDGNPVTELSVNVLEVPGEQSGDANGYIMLQYFVAAPSGITSVNLSVEFNDGGGWATATEGTQIFANTDFDPSDTGDLRIYSWDSVTDFPTAGSGGDNDPVSLRFTFDPGTPGDTGDDMIDEISFSLDNKPQASGTNPYLIPARRRAYLDASISWVPGGLSTVTDYTWEFASVPGGSALVNADIVKTTAMTDYPLMAYFEPDVPGDYELNLYVTDGTTNSDTVMTTVRALVPDNFTGAQDAPTFDATAIGGSAEEPIMPRMMAYDEANNQLFFSSGNNTCFNQDMGLYYQIRNRLSRFDTTTLPATGVTTSALATYMTYERGTGEHCLPLHLDSYNHGSSIAVSYLHYLLVSSTATGTTTYNLMWPFNTDTRECFRNVVGFDSDWVEWEQSALFSDFNPPISSGTATDFLVSGRLAQVVRGTSDLTYWLVHYYDLVSGTVYPGRSYLVEVSGYENATDGNYIPGTLDWHDGVVFPDVDSNYAGFAYDIVVQNTYGAGNPVAWVTIPTGDNQGVYSIDLGATVGNLDTPAEVAGYAGFTPGYLALDEVNGYLFVSSFGNAASDLTAAIQMIDLDTSTQVAQINLPGDYYIEEMAVETSTGTPNTAILFGTDAGRDMIHVIYVDYSGGDPVMTCMPSIDASDNPRDVIFEDTRSAMFVSEDTSNSILTLEPGTTGWIFDTEATALNTANDDGDAEWAVDPTTGDLCMVYDDEDNIWFSRTSDGGLTWSAPVLVDASAYVTDSLDADIAIDSWGNIIVVWSADNATAGDYNILIARSSDGGATWDGPSKVNTDSANVQGDPCVTVDFLGNILVAFENDRTGSGDIGIDMVKSVGHQRWMYFGPVDSNIQVSTPGAYSCSDPDIDLVPYPGYLPDCWVVWSDNSSSTPAVMANYSSYSTTYGLDYASGMTFFFDFAEAYVVNDSTEAASKPRCDYDMLNDVIVVVWEQDTANGAGIYIDEGNKTLGFGVDMVVEEPADASSGARTNPYISIDDFLFWRVVVYESDMKSPGNKEVCWEVIEGGLSGWDGEGIRMNSVTTGDQTRPLVYAYPGPVSIVVWEDARGGVKDIYSKRQ